MDLIGGHLPELIILLIVILIIWGPGKLPDLGAAVGRGIREFRNASAETRESVQNAMATPQEPAVPAPVQAAPVQAAPSVEAEAAAPVAQTETAAPSGGSTPSDAG
jgi:sec-independent protein translocase protein TatA